MPVYRRERIETPDGDFIDLDWIDGPAERPLVVLFHGLEGNSGSHYARALMHSVAMRDWRGVVPHFGHLPGCALFTSGCIGHVHIAAVSVFFVSGFAGFACICMPGMELSP